MPDWNKLLLTVKSECLPARWSKGTELAREAAVTGQSRSHDTWTFRVRVVGRAVAPTVSLYPGDGEWDCDCNGPCDPCEHVAACAIAVAASADAADELFAGGSGAAGVRYELRPTQDGLTLERRVCGDGEAGIRIERSLSELASNPSAPAGFTPTHADLTVDRLLGFSLSSALNFDRALTLLRALVNVEQLRLEGVAVRASAEPVFPRARVVDGRGDSVDLVVEAGADVERIVAPGILLRSGTLHPFGARERFGQRWERLPLRRTFAREAIAELVSTVLPELEREIAVEIRTTRLPKRERRLAPWLKFDIDFVDQGVDVLPSLVYGDPPQARVEGERLVHLTGAVPERNASEEQKLLLRMRDQLQLVPGRRVHFEPADAARFLAQLAQFDDARAGAGERSQPGLRRGALAARIERRGDDIEIVFESAQSAGGRGRASADTVIAAWRDGIGLVPLSDGTFAGLPSAWLARHGALLADLLAAREQNAGKIPIAAFALVGELCEALDETVPLDVDRIRSLLASLGTHDSATREEAKNAVALPAGFHGELRPYQAEGVAWLARLRDAGLGAVLADDMGLGKTVQALCVLEGRALVVCPRSVIHNWAKEIERFRPQLDVSLYHGASRSLGESNVTLTTYATLRNDADTLAGVAWDCVVLDEAQAIKNPDSQTARAAYALKAKFRLSLSGTPIENRLDELWSQMHFTNRGLLGGRRDFAQRYERPLLAGDEAAQTRLRARIRPFLLRRLKREVATELPARTEAILYCELEAEERALYDTVRAAARTDIVRQLAEGRGVMAALEALLRLRQAACHCGLLPGRSRDTSSKVDALMDALDDVVADGHKALVFSQWTSLLDLVEPHLERHGIEHLRLDGSTRDRAAVVDGFQAGAGPPVLLISLKAGGTGLNLTAADHVFLLDPWWNPAVEEQAADRAHRIGQDRPVMVYRMVAKDTVEERVLALQRRKQEIAEAALARDGAIASAAITREEILALLE